MTDDLVSCSLLKDLKGMSSNLLDKTKYMNRTEIVELLSKVIGVSIDEYDYNSSLIEIGFDSLNFIEFIVMIEEKYNVEILDSDLLIENFLTINRIYETLSKYFNFYD